jgi:hypothetical protein
MKNQKMWISKKSRKSKVNLTDFEKNEIMTHCQPIVELFKNQYIKKDPDKRFDYLMDIYAKWYGNYLYFCEKFKSEHPDRIRDEYEVKFVRLERTGNDRYNFSYYRHTGQWFLVTNDLTLKECLEMMQANPSFQPIG